METAWRVLCEQPDFLAEVEAEHAAGASLLALNSRLRAQGIEPDVIATLLSQVELRERAVLKFGEQARLMLFTKAGLEQATRAQVSVLHAARFEAAGCRSVADLGCGIGSESMALAQLGIAPYPVELDPLTARLAEHNLARLGRPAPVIRADAEHLALPAHVDGVFLDPARRTAGHRETRRLTRPEDYSPSLVFAFGLADHLPTGVKLGPGFPREMIPAEAEAQWISVDGQLVETGLWFGDVARPQVRRAALVLRGEQTHELTAEDDAADVETGPLGEYVHEPDGAVIRARLIGLLADRMGASMLSDGIAYLTSDRAHASPFAQSFRVLEKLPVKEKLLKRALSERGIGSLEIKKRGVPVEPSVLRSKLRLRGPNSATLILTRAKGRHVALLAQRCT